MPQLNYQHKLILIQYRPQYRKDFNLSRTRVFPKKYVTIYYSRIKKSQTTFMANFIQIGLAVEA